MKKLLYFISVLFAVISMASCSSEHNTDSKAETIHIKKGEKVVSATYGYRGNISVLTEKADSGYAPKVKTLSVYQTNDVGDVRNVLLVYKLVEQ